MYNKQKGLEGS